MTGCTDQRLGQRLFAPRLATENELDDKTVESADRLGSWMGVGKLGAAAGFDDEAFRLEPVADQSHRQDSHQRTVPIVLFVATARLLGGHARLEAIKSQFGRVAHVEHGSWLVIGS